MIKKGTWVLIHNIVLTPQERSDNIPVETKKVPLELWIKGFLLEDSELGQKVKIETITNRIVEGVLLEENPAYKHSFGKYIPEISKIDKQLSDILWEGV